MLKSEKIKEYNLKFQEQLKCLDSRASIDQSILSDLNEFYRKRSAVEQDYAESLHKLNESFRQRLLNEKQRRQNLPKYSSLDLINTLIVANQRTSHSHFVMAHIFGQQMTQRLQDVQEDVIRLQKQSRELLMQCQKNIIQCHNKLNKDMKSYSTSYQIAEEARKNYEKVRDRLCKKDQKHSADKNWSTYQTSNKYKKLIDEVNDKKEIYDSKRLSSDQARNEYIIQIAATNKAIEIYSSQEIHDVLECLNYGYHNNLSRAILNHINCEEALITSHRTIIDMLHNNMNSIDARKDTGVFLENYSAIFSRFQEYKFHSAKDDTNGHITVDAANKTLVSALISDLKNSQQVSLVEVDEIWKTIEEAAKNLNSLISQQDFEVADTFLNARVKRTKDAITGISFSLSSKDPVASDCLYTTIRAKVRDQRIEQERFYIECLQKYLTKNNNLKLDTARLEKLFTGERCRGSVSSDSPLDDSQNAGSYTPGGGLGPGGGSCRITRQATAKKGGPGPGHRRLGVKEIQSRPLRLFGGSLEEYIERTGRSIPTIIEVCIRVISQYGMRQQGIFRVSGSQTEILEFRELFEKNDPFILSLQDAQTRKLSMNNSSSSIALLNTSTTSCSSVNLDDDNGSGNNETSGNGPLVRLSSTTTSNSSYTKLDEYFNSRKFSARDINSISGLLKGYLRELVEPIFPNAVFNQLIDCLRQDAPEEVTVANIREVLNDLTDSTFVVLRYLFGFLKHLSEFKEDNKMESSNLAICLGPCLMPLPADLSNQQFEYTPLANKCIQLMIDQYQEIFEYDDPEIIRPGGPKYERQVIPPLSDSMINDDYEDDDLTESVDSTNRQTNNDNVSELSNDLQSMSSSQILNETSEQGDTISNKQIDIGKMSESLHNTITRCESHKLPAKSQQDDMDIKRPKLTRKLSDSDMKKLQYAVTIADYKAGSHRELSFKKGQSVKLYKKLSEHWWEGCLNVVNSQGDLTNVDSAFNIGLIPNSYLSFSDNMIGSLKSFAQYKSMTKIETNATDSKEVSKKQNHLQVSSDKDKDNNQLSPNVILRGVEIPLEDDITPKINDYHSEDNESFEFDDLTQSVNTNDVTIASDDDLDLENTLAEMMKGFMNLEQKNTIRLKSKQRKEQDSIALEKKFVSPLSKHTPDRVRDLMGQSASLVPSSSMDDINKENDDDDDDNNIHNKFKSMNVPRSQDWDDDEDDVNNVKDKNNDKDTNADELIAQPIVLSVKNETSASSTSNSNNFRTNATSADTFALQSDCTVRKKSPPVTLECLDSSVIHNDESPQTPSPPEPIVPVLLQTQLSEPSNQQNAPPSILMPQVSEPSFKPAPPPLAPKPKRL